MWASDYRMGFVYTYLNNILLYDNVMAAKDNAWGPAHEIGHIHQRAINLSLIHIYSICGILKKVEEKVPAIR